MVQTLSHLILSIQSYFVFHFFYSCGYWKANIIIIIIIIAIIIISGDMYISWGYNIYIYIYTVGIYIYIPEFKRCQGNRTATDRTATT